MDEIKMCAICSSLINDDGFCHCWESNAVRQEASGMAMLLGDAIEDAKKEILLAIKELAEPLSGPPCPDCGAPCYYGDAFNDMRCSGCNHTWRLRASSDQARRTG